MNLQTHWNILDALNAACIPADKPPVAQVIAAIVDAQGRVGLDGANDATRAAAREAVGAAHAYNDVMRATAELVERDDAQRADRIRRVGRLVLEDATAVARSAGVEGA